MNDTIASTALLSILICHIAVIAIGYKRQKTTVYISYLNAVLLLGVFIFLAFDSPNIKQHNFEFREVLVLGVEACIFLFAVYSIMGFHTKTYVKVINYFGFGIHLAATIGMLYFILTFKLDKLF